MRKNFFAAAMILALGVGGFSACSSDDLNAKSEQTQGVGSTFMSVRLSLPTAAGTRAAADGQDKPDPDYNHIGEWRGKDKIATVTAYIFNASTNTLESKKTFTEGEFQLYQPTSAGVTQSFIQPLKGIKVTPGQKKVYVVVNETAEATALLGAVSANSAPLADFLKVYTQLAIDGTADDAKSVLSLASVTPGVIRSASEYAEEKVAANKVATKNGKENDQILMTMTEEPQVVDVKDGISEKQAIAGENRAKATVTRAVARVLVSTKAESYVVKGDNPYTAAVETGDQMVELATVSDLKFVVGQGERQLHISRRLSKETTNFYYATPAYAFVPSGNEYNTTGSTVADEALKNYDYVSLWKENAAGGVAVPLTSTYKNSAVIDELEENLTGEFILPNTHKWGEKSGDTGYRKGNTAYVLVRGKMKPAKVTLYNTTNQQVETKTWQEYVNAYQANPATYGGNGKDMFLGANGKFYVTRESAKTAAQGGVTNQKSSLYADGKVLYWAWINPDKITKGWMNSPVVRNNVYHIEIAGLKVIGGNWNPLVPGDPTSPNNPDPKPNDPDEPDPKPVDPDDPLTPEDTWMSVETTILPWEVHSYSVELDI